MTIALRKPAGLSRTPTSPGVGVRARLSAALAGLCLLGVPAAAQAQATWRLEQPPPPPSVPFATPLGEPGDVEFLAPNRGLIAVEGNTTIPRGLFFFDGEGWHQLATVCGGPAEHARIAWAGPAEFWTITEPSLPRFGPGRSVCHVEDGIVVGSYSSASEDDPYHELYAAACAAPDDCWFGGSVGQDGFGVRRGGFHLRWDGADLDSVYAPQGRAVSGAVAMSGGTILEAMRRLGTDDTQSAAPVLAEPEDAPRLLHRLVGGAFANEPFVAAAQPGLPDGAADLDAIDGDGTRAWAVGGAARPTPDSSFASRGPIAVYYDGIAWHEVPLGTGGFATTDRFVDVAVVPGTDTAWATVRARSETATSAVRARVVKLTPAGVESVQQVPATGTVRGPAAKLDCTGVDDCWLVTRAGWVFHLTDGTTYEKVTDAAFQGTITTRPNEAIEQFVPDAPPVDDSLKFAPPPVDLPKVVRPKVRRCQRIPALLGRVRSKLHGSRRENSRRSSFRLEVSFRLRRPARLGLVGLRGGRVVARGRARVLRPGVRRLTVRVSRARFPTRLRLTQRELRKPVCRPVREDDQQDTIEIATIHRSL